MRYSKWILTVAVSVILFGGCIEDSRAFSLKKPWATSTQKWNESVERYEGVPFKHRTYGNETAEVMRVIDGDTFYVKIVGLHPLLGYEIGIRVYGIDTRELGDKGEKSKEFVQNFLHPGMRVELKNLRRGKYFRVVADVFVGGESLAEILLEKGLAYPYYGGKKRPLGWKPKDYVVEEDTE